MENANSKLSAILEGGPAHGRVVYYSPDHVPTGFEIVDPQPDGKGGLDMLAHTYKRVHLGLYVYEAPGEATANPPQGRSR